MIKVIDFVVSGVVGAKQRGLIQADEPTTTIHATSDQEIPLNLRQADMQGHAYDRDVLNIVLVGTHRIDTCFSICACMNFAAYLCAAIWAKLTAKFFAVSYRPPSQPVVTVNIETISAECAILRNDLGPMCPPWIECKNDAGFHRPASIFYRV